MFEGEVLGSERKEQILFSPLKVENLHWQYGAMGETLQFPQLLHAKESEISSGCATKSARLPFIPQETGISNNVPSLFVPLLHVGAYNDNNKLFIIKTALSCPARSTG